MTLNEYQKMVDTWIKEHGVRYFDEKTNTLLLMEEVGEFSRLVARIYGEQSFKLAEKSSDHNSDLADEWADIFFVMTCLANQMGIDTEKAIQKNFAKKTDRDLDRHKSNDKLQ